MGLTARVVLTVALLAVGIVVLDTALTRWALEQRFLRYVHERETEMLSRIAGRLGEIHAWRGSLADLDGRALARAVVRAGRPDDRPPPDGEGHRRAGARADFRFVASLLPRLRIEDAGGRVLLPPREPWPADAEPEVATIVSGETVVGRVALVPARGLARDADRRFVREVGRLILWIAALAAVVGSVVGWLLSRRLLVPIRAVTDGARALADGRYSLRLPETRRDELGALARDFNALARALEQARDARQRWLADVAHELRTPLAVLRAEIDALADGVRPADGAALASLSTEMDRLSRLVDDLHQLSLADAGALDYRFAPTDLTALVRENGERFAARLADEGLDLAVEVDDDLPVLHADADRLDQLVGNLLENALRYTDAPGRVRLAAARAGDGVDLRVEDSAPGVPEGEADGLFERFARLEASRSREHGGAGLGLAIVRSIAVAHGGTVTATHSPLGGLAVRIHLPVEESSP